MFRPIHGHLQVDRNSQQNLKIYDQPDDGYELAETCRYILIIIYFLHTTVVLLTTFVTYNFRIYFVIPHHEFVCRRNKTEKLDLEYTLEFIYFIGCDVYVKLSCIFVITYDKTDLRYSFLIKLVREFKDNLQCI